MRAWWSTGVAAVAVVVAAALVVLSVPLRGEQLVLFALSALAVVGVFFLFASAVGLVRMRDAEAPKDVTRAYIEQSDNAIELIDADGQVVFANIAMQPSVERPRRRRQRWRQRCIARRAAGTAAGRRGAGLGGLFPPGPCRRARAARRRTGVVDASRASGCDCPCGASASRGAASLTAWRATDITHEQSRNLQALRKLQDSVRYLDALPIGFSRATPTVRSTT